MSTPLEQLRALNPIIGNPPRFDTNGKYRPHFYLNDLFELAEKGLAQDGLPIEQAEQHIKESDWGTEYLRLLSQMEEAK